MPELEVVPPLEDQTKRDWTSDLEMVVWLRSEMAVPVLVGHC